MSGSAGPLGALTARTPAVYTIPSGAPFLETLARTIGAQYADDPLGLADLTVFLPNRRAVRTALGVFGAVQGAGRTALLPRLRALGDIDEEDLALSGGMPAEAFGLAPAADPLARRLILARLVRAHRAALGREASARAALTAADHLARFLDEMHRDGVPFEKLSDEESLEIPARGAQHWQEALAFLDIVGTHWPAIIAQEGVMDGAARRVALMGLQSRTLDNLPGPVIVAGALGTARATAAFMADVARHPAGLVVLPGLDLALDADAWDKIEAPHPQSLFRDWLAGPLDGADRSVVHPWPDDGGPGGDGPREDGAADRRALLSLVLRPAGATGDWYAAFSAAREDGTLARACEGLGLAVADTENEEAEFVALTLREVLATPGRTGMLVTPDRRLARRVTTKLRSFGIEIDDTGGVPLTETFRGTFLRTVAGWLDDPGDPLALCALLDHDLSGCGADPGAFRLAVRRLNKKLRGPRPLDPGAFLERFADGGDTAEDAGTAIADTLRSTLKTARAAPDLRARLEALVTAAETIAATEGEGGAERLWRYEDGEALASTLRSLLDADHLNGVDDGSGLLGLLDVLMSGVTVRRMGVHPRIAIYGLLEARLQRADVTILSGLNEGVWPRVPGGDPFVSRSMRQALGLTSIDQMIGRAAHDFESHAAAGEVLLTRSRRRAETPTNPSRWLVRLQTFLDAAGLSGEVDRARRLRTLGEARHRPTGPVAPVGPPNPRPAFRPGTFRVTDLGKLLRDPYAVYARLVLGLKEMDPLDAEIGYGERGSFVHKLFERAAAAEGDYAERARALVEDAMAEHEIPPIYLRLWSENIERAIRTYDAYERTVLEEGTAGLVEEGAEWALSLPSGEVRLRGRPDRIDLRDDDTASVIDFKTSSNRPTIRQDMAFDPQLSTLALMVEAGQFEKIGPRTVHRITYLNALAEDPSVPIHSDLQPAKTGRKKTEDKHLLAGVGVADHLTEVRRRIIELLEDTVYGGRAFPSHAHPEKTSFTGAYDHLARRGEWALQGEGDDDGRD